MKLYLVVRGDLALGYRVPQLCHAQRLFIEEHPGLELEWYRTSNTVVCLRVDGAEGLMQLAEDAERAGVAHSVFREPDIGNEPTAMAIAPGSAAKRICRRLLKCEAP